MEETGGRGARRGDDGRTRRRRPDETEEQSDTYAAESSLAEPATALRTPHPCSVDRLGRDARWSTRWSTWQRTPRRWEDAARTAERGSPQRQHPSQASRSSDARTEKFPTRYVRILLYIETMIEVESHELGFWACRCTKAWRSRRYDCSGCARRAGACVAAIISIAAREQATPASLSPRRGQDGRRCADD